MLQDYGIHRFERKKLHPLWVRFWFVVLFLALTGFILYQLPFDPGEADYTDLVSEQELINAVASMRIKHLPPISERTRDLAHLGRQLFFDKRLSQDGTTACASCHDPSRSFSSPRHRMRRDSLSLINSYSKIWFGWAGEADSLTSMVLSMTEDRRGLGISRLYVARILQAFYFKEYKALFGRSRLSLGPSVPEHAAPARSPLQLPIGVSSYALSTLHDFDRLQNIVDNARKSKSAPASYLVKAADPTNVIPDTWKVAYQSLNDRQKIQLNTIFANYGRAIASYLWGVTATDSAFDRFAVRLERANTVASATNDEFNDAALRGLQIFVGKGRCGSCHSGPFFTDNRFHNLGTRRGGQKIDFGRTFGVLQVRNDPFGCYGPYLTMDRDPYLSEACWQTPYLDPGETRHIGAFRTPSLRNVSQTAPYMHSGGYSSLRNAILHHSNRLLKTPLGDLSPFVPIGDLTDSNVDDLVAFLQNLNAPILDLTAAVAAAKAHKLIKAKQEKDF